MPSLSLSLLNEIEPTYPNSVNDQEVIPSVHSNVGLTKLPQTYDHRSKISPHSFLLAEASFDHATKFFSTADQ